MKIKKSKEDKIFDIFLYGIAIIILIIVLYPMYFIIIASFSNPAEVAAGNITFFPKGPTLKGYRKLAEYAQLWVGYKNTILYTVIGTLITLVTNIPAAYALSRRDLYGRKFLTVFF